MVQHIIFIVIITTGFLVVGILTALNIREIIKSNAKKE